MVEDEKWSDTLSPTWDWASEPWGALYHQWSKRRLGDGKSWSSSMADVWKAAWELLRGEDRRTWNEYSRGFESGISAGLEASGPLATAVQRLITSGGSNKTKGWGVAREEAERALQGYQTCRTQQENRGGRGSDDALDG